MLVNIWAAYAAYMAMSILITLAASIVVCVARGAGKDDTAAINKGCDRVTTGRARAADWSREHCGQVR